MRIRVFEAFAGYGSQMMALRRVARRHAGAAEIAVDFADALIYALKKGGEK